MSGKNNRRCVRCVLHIVTRRRKLKGAQSRSDGHVEYIRRTGLAHVLLPGHSDVKNMTGRLRWTGRSGSGSTDGPMPHTAETHLRRAGRVPAMCVHEQGRRCGRCGFLELVELESENCLVPRVFGDDIPGSRLALKALEATLRGEDVEE